MSTLILTHEQADFDAVASLWAAHRLNPDAAPVLPRRVNRNVRAFLTLYGEHFAFVETEDLSRKKVERAIVVDAQAAASVKGMSAKTEIAVVDHHPADSPEAPTGATTTLLVERLADSLSTLSPIEATLLLLGIYEDTGSLAYLTTTARDARAAAFLLDAGAQLDVAREFLHHPLTPGQRILFDQLIAAVETHTVNGEAIALAAIDGGDSDEELSTLAHQLRDTLEPAALFVLVALRGHEPRVQLIARSTTTHVDVGAVAAHFGGGGHGRAAAALIRNRALTDVRAELLARLPDHVQPALTVAQIMSRGVQTLAPELTVREAAERFKKYSYEGYPVIAGGRVAGLLTRRALDRALHHHLDSQPISAIMESGEVTVSPVDSLEHLQKLMAAQGWGQVPVIENGAVVGVVTRTDLIKRLAAPVKLQRRNLADQLAAVLTPDRFALIRLISDEAARLDVCPFIVGGFVRDLLLGAPSQDFDIVVEGKAVKLARALAASRGGRVTAHAQFGTAKWTLPPGSPLEHLDFVSARTEFYAHPSALPEVEHSSIKLDLHRRDFTINTLAIRLDGAAFGDVLDFWGGERDLRDGLIRVLHSISFVDDPTRILRAARFEQRFHFRIEPRTAELIDHARHLLHRVSGDRIRHELEAILEEEEPDRILARLAELDVLSHIHPNLAAVHKTVGAGLAPAPALSPAPTLGGRPQAGRPQAGRPQGSPLQARWAAWLSPLSPAALDAVAARLHFNAKLAGFVRQVAALRSVIKTINPASRMSELHARLRSFDHSALQTAIELCGDRALRDLLSAYATRARTLRPATTGDDLKALGILPGPRYAEILDQLLDAYLDGEIENVEGEKELLKKIAW